MKKTWSQPNVETLNLTETCAAVKGGTVPDGAIYDRDKAEFKITLASGCCPNDKHWQDVEDFINKGN